MSALKTVLQRWNESSLRLKFLSVSGVILAVVIVALAVSQLVMPQNHMTTQPEAMVMVPSVTTSNTPSLAPTPTPTPSQPPTEEVPQDKQVTQRQPTPQVEDVAVAPVINPATANSSEYGSALIFNTLNQPIPSGILYATAALPDAQGTGPITYSVTGLPTGAGFDATSRKIYVDGAPFFDANKQTFQDQANCPQWKAAMRVNVQYSATGPGGTSTISVPVSFGFSAVPGGMFHFGC